VRVNSRGYIPERVVFFARPEVVRNKGAQALFVRPAFPVADQTVAKDGKTLKNAKAWALGNWKYSDFLAEKIKDVKGTPVNNVPRDGYRILSAEQRGEGGRAWKVITPDGFLVDLREDVFLPILLRLGLPASGLIQAKFQWCQAGSQLRLEEVGSKQHGEYTPAANLEAHRKAKQDSAKVKAKAKPRVKLSELVVGGVYAFSFWGSEEERVYLGRAMHDGKKRTVWMDLRRGGTLRNQKQPTTNNEWFHWDWKRSIKAGWGHSVILASGSTALRRVEGGDVTMMPDWQKKITHWRRSGYCDHNEIAEIEWL
jgi:hypothetical protein